MPCYLTFCDATEEATRFGASLVAIYAYHFVWDKLLITPVADRLVKHRYITKDKRDKMRECLWKNASIGTLSILGLYIGWHEDWFMNPHGYFKDWPSPTSELRRWHYMIYIAFWIQAADFMLNITNKHYVVKRKDNAEMLIHHFVTLTLMVTSYAFDLTRVGMCVLMIHEVNDLLLETAKIFIYLEKELLANVFFALFAVTWFIVRWAFYGYNILWSAYSIGYEDLLVPIKEKGSFAGLAFSTWWWFYVGFITFLGLLLVLHIFWGVILAKAVAKTLQDGNIKKDARSDSETEDDSDKDKTE